MLTHATFYVRRLRPNYLYKAVSRRENDLRVRGSRPLSSGSVLVNHSGRRANQLAHAVERSPDNMHSALHEENNRAFDLELRESKLGTII